ncbi:protein RALF-like 19 [Ziziphus jujuba]|uniref:Protein RALF-like 19 n=2 Tax=Ziziphus jujuba TaxID=326968 RepID=A0A6P4A816_ZIZJJ|nr:protein RALF-like 19 [Ziziphus jujuba]KAH7546020.1 hypothetical protein FEM48_Zijuj01G0156500 [Ziziphus jujuba var. spinosa]
MEVKLCLIFLLLALAVVAEASSFHDASWGLDHLSHGSVGDFIGEDNEMLMDSEASRRALAGGRKYISYSALKKNRVPCGRRGQSYYNCQKRQRANPYKRGCTVITHCARFTD